MVNAADLRGVYPHAALTGMLAPLGGGKGFALAFLDEALAAAAVGPLLATDVLHMFDPATDQHAQRIGHLVITLQPAAVGGDDAGQDRMDQLAKNVAAAGGRVPGASRPMPGEVDDNHLPIALAQPVRTQLADWARRLEVDAGVAPEI